MSVLQLEGGVERLDGLLDLGLRTMQEIRMAEVEIISMLMPAAASVSKVVAATPGFDFMPAPTRLTRAMPPSLVTPEARSPRRAPR